MPHPKITQFVREAPALTAKQLREMFTHPEGVGARNARRLIRDLVDARAALNGAARRLAPTVEGDDQKKTKATRDLANNLLRKSRDITLAGFWDKVEWRPLGEK